MPIPIAKEQDRFDVPQAASNGGNAGKIMQINTGLPEATNNLTEAMLKAHNTIAQIKIDNDTARANQLTMDLEQQQTQLMTSTDVDENGEVIGFLNKEGNEAFNSIETLDKRLAQSYNAYLAEMSKLSPVAIEKLLLKGKEVTNNTQEKAFQHAYNEHDKYIKNVAKASTADIVSQASGDDKLLSEQNLNHFDIIRQNNYTIYRGQSEEFIEQMTRQDIENYVKVATNDIMKKFSNSPLMGAGATVAKNFLQDAFDKGFVSDKFRSEQGHDIDQEAALSTVGKLTLENYDRSAKFIRNRKDLNDSEKNLYINNLDKARENLKKQSGGAIAKGLEWKFNQIPKMPHAGDVAGIVKALVKNELVPFMDEKDKKLKFIHTKEGVQTVMTPQQYADAYGFGGLFNAGSDIEKEEKQQEINYIWEVASNLHTAAKNGATSKDFNDILKSFERDVKSDLPQDMQNKYDGNDVVINNTHFNLSGKGSEKTGELSDSALERGMQGYSANRGAPNESEARRAVANFLPQVWKEAQLQVGSVDDVYKRDIETAEKVKELLGRKSTLGIGHGGNDFVNAAMDELIKRIERAKTNGGYEIIIPSKDGKTSLSAIYKGEVDFSNVIFSYMNELLQKDSFMNANGTGLKDRFNFLNDSQKQELTNMLEEQMRSRIGYNALQRRSHLIYKTNGLTVNPEDADRLLRMIVDKGGNSSAIVSSYADLSFPYDTEDTSPVAGGIAGASTAGALMLGGVGLAAGIGTGGGVGALVYEFGGPLVEKVFGEGGFSQVKTYNTEDLKLYTVTGDEYKKASKEGRIYADTELTPIIDYTKNYVKEEMPVSLNNLAKFFDIGVGLSASEAFLMSTQEDITSSEEMYKYAVSGSLKNMAKQDIVKKQEFTTTLGRANDRLRDAYKEQFDEDFNEDEFNAFIAEEKNADIMNVNKILADGDKDDKRTWYAAAAIAYDLSKYTEDNRDVAYFNFDGFNKARKNAKRRYSIGLK